MADAGTAVFRAVADFQQALAQADKLGKGMEDMARRTETSVGRAGKTVEAQAGKLRDFGAKAERTGQRLSLGLTLPLTVMGGVALKQFSDFETGIARAAATAGASSEQMDQMREAALRMGADTQFSASEAASAMYEMTAAGIAVDDVLNGALDSVLLLAGATGTDLASAAAVVTQSMNAFGLEADQTGHVADVMTQAVNQGALDMQGLSEAMAHAGQTGATANQDIESVVTAIQAITDQSVPAAQAGTAVAQAMQSLKAPKSDEAVRYMKDLGIEVRNADGQMKQFPEIVREVEEGLKGLSQAEKDAALDAMFGVEGMKAMGLAMNATTEIALDTADGMASMEAMTIGLTKVMGKDAADAFIKAHTANGKFVASGADAITAMDAMNRGADGVAATFEEKLGGTTARKIEELKGSFETLAIRIIGAVVPALKSAIDAVIPLVNWFSELFKDRPGLAKLVVGFLLLLAALGPLLIVIGKISTGLAAFAPIATKLGISLGALFGWIIVIVAAIAALVAGVIWAYRNVDWFREAVDKVAAALKRFVKDTIDKVVLGFKALRAAFSGEGITSDGFIGVMERIGVVARDVVDKVTLGFAALKSAFSGEGITSDGFVGVMERIGVALRALVDWAQDAWPRIQEAAANTIDWFQVYVLPIIGMVIQGIIENVEWLWEKFQEVWPSIQSVIEVFVEFIDQAVVPILQDAFQFIGELVAEAQKWWEENFTDIKETTESVFERIRQVVEPTLNVLLAAVKVFAAVVTWIWENFGDKIVNLVMIAWEFIKSSIRAAMKIIQGIIETVMAVIRGDWGAVWDGIKKVLAGVWDGIVALVTFGINAIWEVIKTVGRLISEAWSFIWEGIKGVASGIWEGIVDGVTSGINWVIRTLNSMIGAVNWILNKLPGDLSIPEISEIGKSSGSGYSSGGDARLNALARRRAGGFIPGTMSGDVVPAMLEPGEFVLRRRAVDAIGLDTLYRMNDTRRTERQRHGGMIAGFRAGGLVGGLGDLWDATGGKVVSGVAAGADWVTDKVKNAVRGALYAAWKPIRDRMMGAVEGRFSGDGVLDGLVGGGATKIAETIDKLLKDDDEKYAAQVSSAGSLGPGSTTGVVPEFLNAFLAYAGKWGLSISSAFRSRAKQEELWNRYGRNPRRVARPGTSNHERGLAIDHTPDSTAAMRADASNFGLRYPMSWEPWHVEPISIQLLKDLGYKMGGLVEQLGGLPKFHTGGYVAGPGPSVMALLQRGEGVMSVKAMDRLTASPMVAPNVAAGGSSGRTLIEKVEVNNPVGEPTEDSLDRTMRQLVLEGVVE